MINAQQANKLREKALSLNQQLMELANKIYDAAARGHKGIVYDIKNLTRSDVDSLIDMIKHNGYHVYIDIDGNLSISWAK